MPSRNERSAEAIGPILNRANPPSVVEAIALFSAELRCRFCLKTQIPVNYQSRKGAMPLWSDECVRNVVTGSAAQLLWKTPMQIVLNEIIDHQFLCFAPSPATPPLLATKQFTPSPQRETKRFRFVRMRNIPQRIVNDTYFI